MALSAKPKPVAEKPKLSAVNLKAALWRTLQAVQAGDMIPSQGDAVAAQGREILRTVKVQLQVAGQAKRSVPRDVVDFAYDE